MENPGYCPDILKSVSSHLVYEDKNAKFCNHHFEVIVNHNKDNHLHEGLDEIYKLKNNGEKEKRNKRRWSVKF